MSDNKYIFVPGVLVFCSGVPGVMNAPKAAMSTASRAANNKRVVLELMTLLPKSTTSSCRHHGDSPDQVLGES